MDALKGDAEQGGDLRRANQVITHVGKFYRNT